MPSTKTRPKITVKEALHGTWKLHISRKGNQIHAMLEKSIDPWNNNIIDKSIKLSGVTYHCDGMDKEISGMVRTENIDRIAEFIAQYCSRLILSVDGEVFTPQSTLFPEEPIKVPSDLIEFLKTCRVEKALKTGLNISPPMQDRPNGFRVKAVLDAIEREKHGSRYA